MPDPSSVIAACRAARAGSIEIPVDFEHASHVKGEKGERADAIGWVRDLEVREGALWGRVEWLATGREAVASRAYRFVSPGFHFRPGSREVSRLVSVGLTNVPNFSMPALNRSQEILPMDADVLKALGLAPDVGPAAALAAINALKTAEQTALNRAAQPDPEKFVPRADHDLALNRLTPNTFQYNNLGWSGSSQWPVGSFHDTRALAPIRQEIAMGGGGGLFLSANSARAVSPQTNLHCRITSEYTTGWLPGAVTCMDFTAFIDRIDRPGALFYLDPPYYGCEDDYGRELFSRTRFEDLADQLGRLKGRFMLSLNDRPEVREIFGRFMIAEVKTTYTVGSQAGSRGERGEVLVSNYVLETA